MRERMFSVWFITVVCLLGLANPSTAQCDPDGNVQFVCGYVNPEDLVAVPRSPWVIVSSKEGLHAADTRDNSKAVLFPTGAARSRHDTATYGACPGPITGEFEPLGLSLRPGADETHTLYVVRPGSDGGRISVEVLGLSGFPNPETLNMTRSCADEGLIGQPRLEEYGPCIARRRRGVVSDQARLRTGVDP